MYPCSCVHLCVKACQCATHICAPAHLHVSELLAGTHLSVSVYVCLYISVCFCDVPLYIPLNVCISMSILVRVLPSLYLCMWVHISLLAPTQASLITGQHVCSFPGLSVSYTSVSLPMYTCQLMAVPICGRISGCARLPARVVVLLQVLQLHREQEEPSCGCHSARCSLGLSCVAAAFGSLLPLCNV